MTFKKVFTAILSLALVSTLLMSFVSNNQDETQTNNMEISTLNGNDSNCCCPPGWLPTSLFPDDPAAKWDRNDDGLLCFKSGDPDSPTGTTPQGNGNDPLFTQSNVKDNNQPCGEDDPFIPCEQ
jgi:hypothetical protein